MHVGKKCGGYMCELRELDSVVTEDRVAVWVFQCVACNVSLLSVRRLLICLDYMYIHVATSSATGYM